MQPHLLHFLIAGFGTLTSRNFLSEVLHSSIKYSIDRKQDNMNTKLWCSASFSLQFNFFATSVHKKAFAITQCHSKMAMSHCRNQSQGQYRIKGPKNTFTTHMCKLYFNLQYCIYFICIVFHSK